MPEIRPTINIALVILAFFLGLAQFAAAGDKSEIIGELKIPEEGKSQIIYRRTENPRRRQISNNYYSRWIKSHRAYC